MIIAMMPACEVLEQSHAAEKFLGVAHGNGQKRKGRPDA
jgi:hypothetical protein